MPCISKKVVPLSAILCDTHCHLNLEAYDGDRAEVITRAQAAGVYRMLVIGFDLASCATAVDLARHEALWAAIGIHPESGQEWSPETRDKLSDLYQDKRGKIAAYGEIGLDYHWETIPRAQQRVIFLEQIAFAATLSKDLPLIIHCRDAFDDVLSALRESGTKNPIVMHCFTGDSAAAEACLELGCYLGVGGVLTYKKSGAIRYAVAQAPLDRLMLETDCPYLSPQPWRGKRNEPAYVAEVARILAETRATTVDEVAAVTTATANRVFRW